MVGYNHCRLIIVKKEAQTLNQGGIQVNRINEYIRVKLNSSIENKANGFYLLATHGKTYSDKEDEFIVEKGLLRLLTKNKIKFEKLPLQGA